MEDKRAVMVERNEHSCYTQNKSIQIRWSKKEKNAENNEVMLEDYNTTQTPLSLNGFSLLGIPFTR